MKVFKFNKRKYGIHLLMDLCIIEDTPKFSFSSPKHCTDFFEIMIFTEANGSVFLDSQSIELADNTFLFISPFQKRSWDVDPKRTKGYFLIFEKDFLAEFFADKLFVYRLQYFYNTKVRTVFSSKSLLDSFRGNFFDEIRNEIVNYQKDSTHLLRSMLYYLLIKMNREFCKQHHLEKDTQLNNNAYLFKEALEKNIRSKHRTQDYADLLKISRISLNTATKRQFGITATEMIKDRLLMEIKSELLYTANSISEVAYELNFSEPNNLIRFFKSKTGSTPNAFRAAYQNDSH